jgi:hypothetical protein
MKRLGYLALLLALFSVSGAMPVFAADDNARVYLEVLRSPPNRHVIAMNSMKDCSRAAEFTKAKCVSRQPRLPDTSTGVMRSIDWSPPPLAGAVAPNIDLALKGKDFGPVYLVVRRSPPNRHVIAMASMKKCLEAAAFTSAKCLEELPKLPDSSTGEFRSLGN